MADFIPSGTQIAHGGHGDLLEEDPMREAWADALSHELRTPITSIYGGSQLLLRHTVSGPVQVAIIGDIAAEAEHLHRLVEDLLAIVRLPAGTRLRVNGPVLLQHVADEAVRDERRLSPDRALAVHAESDVPAVRGDADYLRHLLRNLISNAVRYSPADTGVEVRIAVDDGEVQLEVLDRGAGFPPGSEEDVFRLFHKSPQAAAQLPGAGIGLFVAKALVEAHGGRIWVRNRPDGGSAVGFALPVHDDAPSAPL